MPRLELFPFRYRNPVTGGWVRARYVATREEIAKGNAEWEIIGSPEIRDVDSHARYFSPWGVSAHTEVMHMSEPAPKINPHLDQPPGTDAAERFLVTRYLSRASVELPAKTEHCRRSAIRWRERDGVRHRRRSVTRLAKGGGLWRA
jgi:hypothetical protein